MNVHGGDVNEVAHTVGIALVLHLLQLPVFGLKRNVYKMFSFSSASRIKKILQTASASVDVT